MDCTTQIVSRINGQLVDKPKKPFDTLEQAIKHAKSVNALQIENSRQWRISAKVVTNFMLVKMATR